MSDDSNPNQPPPSSTTPPASSNNDSLAAALSGLTALLSQLAVNIPAAAAAPPAPVYPQPNPQTAPYVGPLSTNPSTGAPSSIYRIFPQVEAGVLDLIVRHKLRAADLYKLDPNIRNKEARATLELEGGTLRLKTDPSVKDYPSPASIIAPLATYFSILGCIIPRDQAYLLSYASPLFLGSIHQLSVEYEWSAVLGYFIAFFNCRLQDMIDGDYSKWNAREADLYQDFLMGHHKTKSSAASTSHGQGSSSSKKNTNGSEVCRLFNAGSCTTTPCRNGRIHRCSSCQQPNHGANQG